jgi:hypothetical protein
LLPFFCEALRNLTSPLAVLQICVDLFAQWLATFEGVSIIAWIDDAIAPECCV